MAITTRLLLLVAFAVLPALALLAYDEYEERRTRISQIRQQVEQTGDEMVALARDTVAEAHRLSAVIAKLPEVRTAATASTLASACTDLLTAIRQDFPGKLEFGIANGAGLIVCTTGGTTAPVQVRGDHFRRALETNAFTVGTHAKVAATGTHYLSFAFPIRDDTGKPIGAVLTGLKLGWMAEYIRSVFQLPNAVMGLHDRDLVFLARVPEEAGMVGKPPPPEVQNLTRFANQGAIEATGADGLGRIGVIRSLSIDPHPGSRPDLYVAVGVSRSAALGSLNAATMRGLALLLLSAVLAIVAGWWGGRRFVKEPVESLLAASRRWSVGDYSARVGLKDRSMEFGRLATAYEHMAEGLAQREADRSRADKQLAASEERLRLAQEAGAIGLWDLDLKSDRVHRIGSVYTAWGLAEGEHSSSASFYPVVHPDDRERVRAERETAIRDGEGVYETECRIIDPSGAVRWIASRGEVTRDANGEPVRLIGVHREVTDRREALDALARMNADLERQVEQRTREASEAMERLFEAQKMESIGQLTGGVAHDFNNLLMATLGSLGLLRKRLPDDPKAHRFLENAIQGAERGALLTQRLLAFARRQELKPEAVNVPTLVEGMADLLGRSLGPTYDVRLNVPRRMPSALVDPAQLELAILNLCINARDAMPSGGAITVSARTETVGPERKVAGVSPGEYVCVSVADTGIGMDDATIARATEPFFTTKGVGKGTGLGLSMAAGLAAQSGGTLRILSRLGEGTTVEVWLRQAISAERPAASVLEGSRAPVAGRPLIVLVVDDDTLVAMGTAFMLEEMGHVVLSAESGAEGLKVLGSGAAVDLVITDYAMPGLTGVELAQHIEERWPATPVILASGYADLPEGTSVSVPRLFKPYTLEELAIAISDALSGAVDTSNVIPLRGR